MKVYDRLVEKLAEFEEKILFRSMFCFRLLVGAIHLSISLLKWGRTATISSIILTVTACGISILSSLSQQRSSAQLLNSEQSGILLMSALLLLTTVITVRSLARLIWNSLDKLGDRLEVKIAEKEE